MDDKELQLKFLQFLVKKSGAKTQKDLEKYVQSLGEEGLKKAYEEFSKEVINEQNKKVNKAAHGTKLNYVKNLKNQCADDEELVYFKKGGALGCGCRKKMEKGGETPKEENVISKFKKKMDSGFKRISDKLSEKKEGYDKYGNYIVPKEKIKKRDAEKGKLSGVDEEEAVDMKPKKNCFGSKFKLKKGNRIKVGCKK